MQGDYQLNPESDVNRPNSNSISDPPIRLRHILKLYIAGHTVTSLQSIVALKTICEKYLQDNFELEVIDIYQQFSYISLAQIVASPTLVKELPLPSRTLVGDISDEAKVLACLDLQ